MARGSLPSHHQTEQVTDQALPSSISLGLTSPWTPAGPANTLEWIPVNRLDYAQVLLHPPDKNIGTDSTKHSTDQQFFRLLFPG